MQDLNIFKNFGTWFAEEPVKLPLVGIKVHQTKHSLLSSLSADGYAFSQEEHGVVSQSQVVRSYDTTRQRPSL